MIDAVMVSSESANLPDGFAAWLQQQIGPCRWIVARSNKKRRKAGYDRFFTQKRFRALLTYFQKEMTPMADPTLHLTEPNPQLAAAQRKTPHGMAHWAGTGPQGATCRGCKHWGFSGYLAATGLLKDSHCDKYTRMMNGEAGGRLAHYQSACKYFEPVEIERPIENPKR